MLVVLFAALSHSLTVQLPGSLFLRESACIWSSSALSCFLLVPIVLRELVVIVVCSLENFDSFSGVADANSIVECLPGFVFVIHISGVFAKSRSVVKSPKDSSNPELFVSATHIGIVPVEERRLAQDSQVLEQLYIVWR